MQQVFAPAGGEAALEDIAHRLQASRLVTQQLGLQPGQRAVLVNGRVRHPTALDLITFL